MILRFEYNKKTNRLWDILYFIFLLSMLSMVLLTNTKAFSQDSIKGVSLREISISDSSNIIFSSSKSSGSTLNKAMIQRIETSSIGDITKFISGVILKDYGGIGGLKTVSVRGLGSQNTAVVYDGISITDQANGQIDLSKFSINNIENINLSNGQGFSLLQTARSLASANVFYINSSIPKFDSLENIKLSIGSRFGSFYYSNFSIYSAYKLSRKWIISVDLDLVNTSGAYPYTLRYGSSSKDSTSKETRNNSDYFGFTKEVNLYGSFLKSDIRLKAYYFYSERGLPGSTTLYYLRNKQRLWDESTFIQAVYTYNFSKQLIYRNHSKTLYSKTHYLDPDFLNSQGKQEDKYFQNEYYTNNVLKYNWNNNLSSSISNDIIYNNMNSTSAYNAMPNRFTSLSAIMTSYNNNKLLLIGNLLYTYAIDKSSFFKTNILNSHLSPFLSIGYTFYKDFTISMFYKDVYRLPTFNDLYFNIVSPPSLRPEKSKQFNLHLEYEKDLGYSPPFYINLKMDLYNNNVRDKIVAMPSKNLFVWSIINYGEVSIRGMDLEASVRTYLKYSLDISLRATYSLQEARNMTKRISPDINKYNIIPYTPIHSGSLLLNILHPIGELSYTISFIGERYSMIENIERNLLKSYSDHGIKLSKDYEFKKYKLNIGISCLNIFGNQYEIVRNYPMPGRQFRINLKLNLK